jgi:hypothetical protein
VNGGTILNCDSVFWYGARWAAGSDRFLEHSLFFSPKRTAFASNGSWVVLYPDDAEPVLTTFTPIPALSTEML